MSYVSDEPFKLRTFLSLIFCYPLVAGTMAESLLARVCEYKSSVNKHVESPNSEVNEKYSLAAWIQMDMNLSKRIKAMLCRGERM